MKLSNINLEICPDQNQFKNERQIEILQAARCYILWLY